MPACLRDIDYVYTKLSQPARMISVTGTQPSIVDSQYVFVVSNTSFHHLGQDLNKIRKLFRQFLEYRTLRDRHTLV